MTPTFDSQVFFCVSGVAVLAVGLGRANSDELLASVTDSSTQNLLQARDAEDLYRLQPELAELLCGFARGTVVPVRHNLIVHSLSRSLVHSLCQCVCNTPQDPIPQFTHKSSSFRARVLLE